MIYQSQKRWCIIGLIAVDCIIRERADEIRNKDYLIFAISVLVAGVLGGCQGYPAEVQQEAAKQAESKDEAQEVVEDVGSSDKKSDTTADPDAKDADAKKKKKSDKSVDVIFFMGESNMSGFGGDATLAPKVSEKAGSEFRAVSDPTKLYPIAEPFGEKENNSSGLDDFVGAKRGSLVSAFVNEYNKLTNDRVIVVSASMGQTDMDKWTSEGVMTDVKERFDATLSYLKDNGYEADHIYAVWL